MEPPRPRRFLGICCSRVRYSTLLWQSLIWDWLFFYNILLMIASVVAAVFFFSRASRRGAESTMKAYALLKLIFGVLGALGFSIGLIVNSVLLARSVLGATAALIVGEVILALLLWHSIGNIFLGAQLWRGTTDAGVRARYFVPVPDLAVSVPPVSPPPYNPMMVDNPYRREH